MLRNSDRVLPREELIEALWPDKQKMANNTLDAFIHLLRRKIERGRQGKLIHTVRGVGYRLSIRPK
jgi:two-component system response regulator PrrA